MHARMHSMFQTGLSITLDSAKLFSVVKLYKNSQTYRLHVSCWQKRLRRLSQTENWHYQETSSGKRLVGRTPITCRALPLVAVKIYTLLNDSAFTAIMHCCIARAQL